MEKKELIKIGVLYLLVFLIGVISDMQGGLLIENSSIPRNEVGGDKTSIDLVLNIEDIIKDYEVSLEIEPVQITRELADSYFLKTKEKIDEDFKNIGRNIPKQDSYEDGLVEAQWSFSPTGLIESDGAINFQEISESGKVVLATVTLECGAYEQIYNFPFKICHPEWSTLERIEQELEVYLNEEQKKEGVGEFFLPKKLAGLEVTWKEKREYISLKLLFLEILSILLLIFAKRKEKMALIEKRRYERELLYPEIVNQLLILMEAGMTTRQAWHRITIQYIEKRKKELVEESEVFTAIIQMDRRLSEGTNERAAYENFVVQMDSMSYRRLMRLLINNLEKGSSDICQQLGVEAKQAYEQRLLLAKKLGEEASTKMLVPMMLMMILVMVIIMAPAMMGFLS